MKLPDVVLAGLPIGRAGSEGALCPAQCEVVSVPGLLDDALQGTVRHVLVTRPQQQQGSEDAGQTPVAVLERVYREEDCDKNTDGPRSPRPPVRPGMRRSEHRCSRALRPRSPRPPVRPGIDSMFASKLSTSRSVSLAPSIRVEEPMLSMAATRRSRDRRSGATRLIACQAPLNSSISATSRSSSFVTAGVDARNRPSVGSSISIR